MTDAAALQVLIDQARGHEAAGRPAEAAEAYRRLLAAAPGLPNSWYNLARLERRLGRPDAALAAYQRALDLGVEGPEEVRLNRAVILSDDLRRPDAAERELDAALGLNPRYVPALLNLGNLHEDRGRRAEAAAAYRRALELDPRCWLALARLAGLSRPQGPDDALLGRLRAGLADPSASAQDRLDLGFALGRALDACGAWDAAFAACAEANALARRAGGPSAAYDRAAHEARIDRLIARFTPERLAALRSDRPEAPVFICGMFRSGSTLAEQILAAHPAVTAGGELEILPRLAAQAPDALDAAAVAGLARDYAAAVARLFPGADLVTDKRPDNFLHLGLAKAMFPRARIVHTRRAPLDNVLSVFFLQLDPHMSYAHDLADIAHYYRQQERLMAHWKSLFPDDLFQLDYDRLTADPEPEARRLLAFLGLPWDDRVLRFHELDNAVRTASVWQVREPLHRRASGRWRNYAAWLGPAREALGEDDA